MKNSYLPSSLALACAFGLAACGGGHNDLVLTINPIYGVTQDGLTVTNNGGTPEVIPKGTTFYSFTNMIGTDTNYNVQIATSPSNATCTVYNGQGKTGAYAPNNISINCVAIPHNVSATVTGLTGQLDVVNGSMQYKITPTLLINGVFSFTLKAADGTLTGQVGDGNAYGFVILNQPAGQKCDIANGGGVMGANDVTNVAITCVNLAP
jgi:hypothetical protein